MPAKPKTLIAGTARVQTRDGLVLVRLTTPQSRDYDFLMPPAGATALADELRNAVAHLAKSAPSRTLQ